MRKNYFKSRKIFPIMALICAGLSGGVFGCANEDIDNRPEKLSEKIDLLSLSDAQRKIVETMPKNIVIAHRGTTFWAPEETEAAMRWARNMGADYLECDLQMTKDGYLIALHDDNLSRTTDIAIKFPGKENLPANQFTLEELWTLDAGSWFNDDHPELARDGFKGLEILLFEDVLKIAEGYKIKRNPDGSRVYSVVDSVIVPEYEIDPEDNGNRPGVYPETKEPWRFPGIEKKLKDVLIEFQWYAEGGGALKDIPTTDGKTAIANTPFRVVLQTFSKESLVNIHQQFNNPLVPTCMLLWLNPNNTNGLEMDTDSPETFASWINFAIENGATIMGPSISGAPNNYPNLLEPWMANMMRRPGMLIHAYSFDTNEQMLKYSGIWYTSEYGLGQNLVDGWFTNKTGMTMDFFQGEMEQELAAGNNYFISNTGTGFPDNLQKEKENLDPATVLTDLGYTN